MRGTANGLRDGLFLPAPAPPIELSRVTDAAPSTVFSATIPPPVMGLGITIPGDFGWIWASSAACTILALIERGRDFGGFGIPGGYEGGDNAVSP